MSDFPPPPVRDGRRIFVLANCQTGGLTACLDLLLPRDTVTGLHWLYSEEGKANAAAAAADADIVVTSAPPDLRAQMAAEHGFDETKCVIIPSIHFAGFHPDLTIAYAGQTRINVLAGVPYQSAIGVWAWKRGLTARDARRLFTQRTMGALGYDRYWTKAVAETRADFAATTIPFTDYFLPLQASGRLFMHTLNHPHIAAIAQLARGVARRLGAAEADLRQPLEDMVPDALSLGPIWPVYPGVAEALGLQPSWLWKIGDVLYTLDDYLEAQFRALDAADGPVTCAMADTPQFRSILREIAA